MKKDDLTATESYVARKILSEAKRSFKWNEEYGEYQDDGSFLISLEKQELAALTRALRKI